MRVNRDSAANAANAGVRRDEARVGVAIGVHRLLEHRHRGVRLAGADQRACRDCGRIPRVRLVANAVSFEKCAGSRCLSPLGSVSLGSQLASTPAALVALRPAIRVSLIRAAAEQVVSDFYEAGTVVWYPLRGPDGVLASRDRPGMRVTGPALTAHPPCQAQRPLAQAGAPRRASAPESRTSYIDGCGVMRASTRYRNPSALLRVHQQRRHVLCVGGLPGEAPRSPTATMQGFVGARTDQPTSGECMVQGRRRRPQHSAYCHWQVKEFPRSGGAPAR